MVCKKSWSKQKDRHLKFKNDLFPQILFNFSLLFELNCSPLSLSCKWLGRYQVFKKERWKTTDFSPPLTLPCDTIIRWREIFVLYSTTFCERLWVLKTVKLTLSTMLLGLQGTKMCFQYKQYNSIKGCFCFLFNNLLFLSVCKNKEKNHRLYHHVATYCVN